jgi:hypothetical protein
MGPRRLVGIWLDVQTHAFWEFKNDPYPTMLRIANISLIDLPWFIPAARSFTCSSFFSAQCNPHSHSPWSIVSYPMAHCQRVSWTTFILCKWARMPVWLNANLDIATKNTLPWKPSMPRPNPSILSNSNNGPSHFLSIFPVSVNVSRVQSGQSSPVLKQSSRDRSLICQYISPSSGKFLYIIQKTYSKTCYKLYK